MGEGGLYLRMRANRKHNRLEMAKLMPAFWLVAEEGIKRWRRAKVRKMMPRARERGNRLWKTAVFMAIFNSVFVG
jgi:hypothetical protein